MEKNNLKDMVKSLKAKTSKALQEEPKGATKTKSLEESASKNESKQDKYIDESISSMLGDIDLKIAEFYKKKQAKIESLEKDEDTHAKEIVKKNISVPSDFDSVISGIKIDTDSAEEEDDNIGRRVLKEFALDEEDFEGEDDNKIIGVEPKDKDEEFDVLVDIASNGDKEVEEKLIEMNEKKDAQPKKDMSAISSLMKNIPTSKLAVEPKRTKKTETKKDKEDKKDTIKTTKRVSTKSEKTKEAKPKTSKKSVAKVGKKQSMKLTKTEIEELVEDILKEDEENTLDVALVEQNNLEETKNSIEPKLEEVKVEDTKAEKESETIDEEFSSIEPKVEEIKVEATGDEKTIEAVGEETLSNEEIKEVTEDISEPQIPQIDLTADYMKETADESKIKVLYVVTECQPFAATGGLADVAGSLPKAVVKEGVDIRVIMPLYNSVKNKYQFEFEYMGNFTVHLSWRQEYCGLFRYVEDGVTYYFIDNERYFKRDNLYGYFDDGERFAYFCKAVVEGLSHLDFFPDIVHCNDWQSALVPVYLKTTDWQDERYNRIKKIYTIHNVEYQGVYGMENLGDLFGIDGAHASDLDYDGNINLTKGAIELSDKVTTVSRSYCENLKQPYCSRGLHHIIYRNENKLSGIVNGVDNDFYNPMTDKEIACNFDINSKENKIKCKKAWQEELGLPVDPDTPLISMVTRLVSHKGLDLVTRILEDLLKEDIQFVIVGTGDQRFIDYFRYIEGKYPTKVRALVDRFSLEYARKNYAGSDIFLMPSKIEPCGISQMIASRYGSVPIVRETGGLKDTIRDFGCEGGGNGYTFANYNSDDLKYQIHRAIKDFHNKAEWEKKMDIVMSGDFGWEKSAKEYVRLYESVM